MSTKAAAATPTEKKTRVKRAAEEIQAAALAQIDTMKKTHDKYVEEAAQEVVDAEARLEGAKARRDRFLASLRGMA